MALIIKLIKNFSRKSITAHYHPIGMARADEEEKPEDIKKYISRMRKSNNPYISFDNSDPTEFNFVTLSLVKYFIKRYLFRKNKKSECLMDREEILK